MSKIVYLPYPKPISNVTVEEALILRRSIREFTREPLTLEELSLLVWSCQGISDPIHEFRTCPSAGATYPLNLYVVVSPDGVQGLEAGVYKYLVREHALQLVKSGDFTGRLYYACLSQKWVKDAAVNFIITAVYSRTTRYYGERGIRYVILEAGHACQNVYLQAIALGLGAVAIGAFYDEEVLDIVKTEREEEPLYVIAIGRPRTQIRKERVNMILESLIKYYEENRGK